MLSKAIRLLVSVCLYLYNRSASRGHLLLHRLVIEYTFDNTRFLLGKVDDSMKKDKPKTVIVCAHKRAKPGEEAKTVAVRKHRRRYPSSRRNIAA